MEIVAIPDYVLALIGRVTRRPLMLVRSTSLLIYLLDPNELQQFLVELNAALNLNLTTAHLLEAGTVAGLTDLIISQREKEYHE